jgi:hypothetical protein
MGRWGGGEVGIRGMRGIRGIRGMREMREMREKGTVCESRQAITSSD